MLLLTVREWLGPSNRAKYYDRKPRVQLQGFVTRLPLGEAIERLRAYEDDYKRRYTELAAEFNLVAVATIEDLTPEQIGAARLEVIEDLNAWRE